MIDINKIVVLLMNAEQSKLIKLPPALKNEKTLYKFLKFFFSYLKKDREITLKNASKYLQLENVVLSKVHSWIQQVAYNIRICLIEKYCDSENTEQEILNWINENCPRCPLCLKSALHKYKYIVIDNWSKEQLFYCIETEKSFFKANNKFPSFVEENFINVKLAHQVLTNIENLINISETLDTEGKYDLSEKILQTAENLINLKHEIGAKHK